MEFVVRLALVMRVPPTTILRGWSLYDIEVMRQYLSRKPTTEERIEYAIAQLSSLIYNSKIGKDQRPRPLRDFLLFADAFAPDPNAVDADGYTAVDRSFLAGLGG